MLIRRIRYWLNASQREASLRAEMEAHLKERAAELREDGLSEADARAEARRRFGNFSAKQEEAREIWIARYWNDSWQDLRYGARNLRQRPGFAAVVILSAALGIGACSTAFGIVNFALLRPLPVVEPDRLMWIAGYKNGVPGRSLSYPEILDIRNQARGWDAIAAFYPFLPAGISSGGEPQRYWGFLVTANYFDVVKPRFAMGRGFAGGEDDIPGAAAKVVISHALWRSRFGGDAGIIGSTIRVNKRAMTVVGVTASGFRGTEVGTAADFFLPFSQVSELDTLKENGGRLTSYDSQWLYALGRPLPGVEISQAQAGLDAVEQIGSAKERGLYAERAGQLNAGLRRIAVPAFFLLLTVTFLVLLTACANIANLLLARASARSREIATRLALGAGRGRLIRQLMAESILLALGCGLLGVAVASWAGRYIGGFQLPLPLPIDLTMSIDYRVVLFSVLLSGFTGIAFGVVPAFRATRPDLVGPIKSDAGDRATLRRLSLRNSLVVAQVGISAVLVICSGLFLRSLSATRGVDVGMDTQNLLLVRFDPALSRYSGPQASRLLVEILRDAEALPGVRSASVANMMPLSIGGNSTRVSIEGSSRREQGERTWVMAVGPRYFETMGIRLIEGVDFRSMPSSECVVVVNEELARRLYSNQGVVGRQVMKNGRLARIVGLAANSKYRMIQEREAAPILYTPILDTYAAEGTFGGLTLIVRTAQDPAPLGEGMRRRLLSRDPELVVSDVSTMENHLNEAMFLPRLAASLFGLCGGVGLLIASIGVYGVLSFAVARRTREIGIRMALGARVSQVVRMILWHGATLSLLGILIGVGGGFMLARVASSLLYGVSASDPVTFLTVPLILLAVALLAMAIPARRAASVDLRLMLRAE